jgi:ABC-type dipeptide/oligopeptide/nickel transport system permease component
VRQDPPDARFIVRRLLGVILVLFAVASCSPSSICSRVTRHGHPTSTRRQNASPRCAVRPDDPLWQQYLNYLGNVLRGDLGSSKSTTSRSARVPDRFPATIG